MALASVADLIDAYPRLDIRDDVLELLDDASALVLEATRRDVYPVFAGTTDCAVPVLANAMRDATLAQVQAWSTSGAQPRGEAVDQLAPIVVSTSRTQGPRSESHSYDASGVAAAAAAARASLTELVPRAVRILRAVGLTTGQPSWR